MKSFCIKTNNNAILEYLLDKLDYLELEEVKYSKNKFKIYSNIIVHFIGEKISFFDEKLSSIITDTILKFYKEKMIKKIINFDYFYFEEYEKKIIIQNCCEIIESSEYEQITKDPNVYYFVYNTDPNLSFVTAEELGNYYTKAQINSMLVPYQTRISDLEELVQQLKTRLDALDGGGE